VMQLKVDRYDVMSQQVIIDFDRKAKNVEKIFHIMFKSVEVMTLYFSFTQDGPWNFEIIAPFWFFNSTGLPLELSCPCSFLPFVAGRPGVFCPGSDQSVRIRLHKDVESEQEKCGWSAPVSTGLKDAKQKQYLIVVPEGNTTSRLRVNVEMNSGAYENTNVLAIAPTVLFQNGSSKPVEICQPFSKIKARLDPRTVAPGEMVPIYNSDDNDAMLAVKVEGFQYSQPFNSYSRNESFSLRCCDDANLSFAILPFFLNVDKSSTKRWILRDDDGRAPYIVKNFSSMTVSICQLGMEERTIRVGPMRQVQYAWDHMESPQILVLNSNALDPRQKVSVIRLPSSVPGEPERVLECAFDGSRTPKIFRIKERRSASDAAKVSDDSLFFELVATLPCLRIACIDGNTVTARVVISDASTVLRKRDLSKVSGVVGVQFRYQLGKDYDEATLDVLAIDITSEDKEIRHSTILCCAPENGDKFFFAHLKRMLPGEGRNLVNVPISELRIQQMLLSVDEEFVDAVLFFVEKIVPAEVAENIDIDQVANGSNEPSSPKAVVSKNKKKKVRPLFLQNLLLSPIQFKLAFSPRKSSSTYRSKMSSWLSYGCSILGSMSDTAIVIAGLTPEPTAYASFAEFRSVLKNHYLAEVSNKILGVSRGSGAFGTTANFFARIVLSKKIHDKTKNKK